MPSPFTMWSASIMSSMPGMAATCPPTTIVDCGDKLAHHAAHLAHLADVDDDRGDAHDVVVVASSVRARSASRVGKSSTVQGAEIFAWIIMMPQERWNMRNENAALRARDLVVIKLHRVDGAAAEFVVLRVRAENRSQKNAGARSLGMCFERGRSDIEVRIMMADIGTARRSFQFVSSSVSPHMPLLQS